MTMTVTLWYSSSVPVVILVHHAILDNLHPEQNLLCALDALFTCPQSMFEQLSSFVGFNGVHDSIDQVQLCIDGALFDE